MILETNSSELLTLIQYQKAPIIELKNINKQTIGALYTKYLKTKNIVLSETNNSEKYYLFIDGIGIYFSYFKSITN